MSFDARSKERLEALGRTLPKKLPLPESAPSARTSDPRLAPPGAGPIGSAPQRPSSPGSCSTDPGLLRPGAQGKAGEAQGLRQAIDKRVPVDTRRHRLEHEEDPAELFRALISASPDGTVPPHLLDRLRDLERTRLPALGRASGQASAQVAATRVVRTTPNAAAAPSPRSTRKGPEGATPAGNRGGSRNPGQGLASDDQDLYIAFAQLLLEDDGD